MSFLIVYKQYRFFGVIIRGDFLGKFINILLWMWRYGMWIYGLWIWRYRIRVWSVDLYL